ncbi:MAG: InlB B-repeat-containing protein, partial [Clostridia bacterium]|nr:InlB B-repeat-containing protein [Clostridia bacterium]
WDGVTDLNTYECVWIVEKSATVTHTVTFKVDTNTVATKTVEDGKTVTAPTAPTQSGKTFLGWYTEGGQKYDFSKPVTGDITLIAKFKDNASGDVLLGDVNLDGQVNSIDSNLLKRSVAGEYIIESGSPAALNADINGDGQINSIDSNLLKRKVAGQ